MSSPELDNTAPETRQTPPAAGFQRRHRIVLATAIGTAVVSLAGLGASLWVKSPAQQMADTGAPAPNVLTASVQRTVLTTTVVMRGTFTPGRLVQVAPSAIAPSAGNPGGAGSMVVTKMQVRQGQQIKAGHVLAEYSYRPVYALPGAIPAYRDMTPGESGPDITELQHALAQLGFPCGRDTSGSFGSGTAAAVTRFYRHIGYPAPTGTSPTAAGTSTGAGTQGPIVPMSEAVFLPSFPAYVEQINAQVGDSASKGLLTLSVGGLSLTGDLDPSQQGLVKPGMAASIVSEATGLAAQGTVSSVGAVTMQTGEGGMAPDGSTAQNTDSQSVANQGADNGIPVQIAPSGTWNEGFDGQDVRITLTAASTTTPVLAVPEAAVITGADARTYVTLVSSSGTRRQVEVQAGTSADGLIQVTPVGATLEPGEQVVIGQ